jgi:hypothetical protein
MTEEKIHVASTLELEFIGAADLYCSFGARARIGDAFQRGGVPDLIAREGIGMEFSTGDFRQNHPTLKIRNGPHQNSGGLGHTLDHQRRGHAWRFNKVLMQMIFAQGDHFDGIKTFSRIVPENSVDPVPTHV